jgi:hypothetical protein
MTLSRAAFASDRGLRTKCFESRLRERLRHERIEACASDSQERQRVVGVGPDH